MKIVKGLFGLLFIGAIVGILVMVLVAAVSGDTPVSDRAERILSETTPAEKVKDDGSLGEGVYAVGEDIKPGTYKTVVPDDAINCYWSRLKDFDAEIDSINDNGNLGPGANGRVVIKKTDAGVEFNGPCRWVLQAKK